uniref:Integrase catalytic domain-containing protein n=1 Tax=Fagus sylvatica TaxID=28930 RepID=A0A2N9I636_FAGSY
MSEVPPKSSAAPPVSSTVMTQLDNMSMQMTSNKLDGTNYSAWSQFVELYVTGKGKLGYLTGEKIKPAISDPSFSTWVEENAMLMSWLLNSMTPDINASFLRLPTAHDIWDAVAQTYFTGNDASQIYELRRKAHETRQQGKSLASYFSALQTIWQELDFLNPYDMESAKDTATLKTRIENERVYDFLAGLDPGFDQIRVQVLAQDPTPNLRSTYAFVRREELRQAAMLASPPHESSALMTIQHSPSALVSSGSWKPEDKESLFCTHCKGTKHTRETCFKLNGYPDWFRKKGEGSSRHKGGKTESRAHTTTVHTPQPQYSQAQVDHILKEYAQRLSQKDASCSLANTGSTDHMTHESSNFSSYNTHPSKRCVKTANGSSSAVSGDLLTGTMIGLGRERDGLYYLDLNWHAKEDTGQVHQVVGSSTSEAQICCLLAKHHRTSFHPSFNKSSVPFSIIHSDVWGPSRVTNRSNTKWFVSFIDDCTRVSWVYLLKEKSEVISIFQSFHQMILTQFNTRVQVLRSDNGGEYFKKELSAYFHAYGIIHQTSCVDTPQQNGVAERKNRHLLEVARSLMFAMNVPKSFWGDAVLTAAYLINRMPSKVLQFQTPLQSLSKTHSLPTLLQIPPKVFGCVCYVHIHKQHRSKLDPRAQKCIFLGYSTTQKGYKCYHPPSTKILVSMDVTFLEDQAYFSGGDLEHSLQGENLQSEEKSWNVLPTLELNSVPSSVPSSGPALDSREQASLDQSNDQLVVPVTGNPEIVSSLEPTTPVDSHVDDSNMPIALRKSTRTCPSIYRYPISNYVSSHRLSPSCKAFANQLSSVSIPKNLQEALNNPRWKAAMVEEMEALQKNSTWKLVELPKDKKTVGCKWVFTVKHKADGSIERFKARLVAKGYTQTYGIDYQETFAPVAKINTIRVLLSLAANLEWPLQQFDVKNAFLHGDLEEEVYMDFPPGFSTSSESGKVCRLRKSLYGLKQSPRAWFGRFTHSMRKYGYHQSQSDHTLFLKHSNEGKVTALIVYVDDIVVTGNDIMEMGKLKTYLAKEFEIKDLGTLRYFLGIEVARSKEGIFVSQRKYVLDLLVETGMLACKPIDTPIEQNHRLGEDVDDTPVDRERYQKLVGKLIYLSHTRPDIAFAVSVVSQFMHAPCEKHMEAVYRILRYLKSAPGKGLMLYKNGHLEVEGYTDADWAGSITDRRSTSGYCTFVGGNLVTWRSKKQSVVARSSAEAEFRAMAHGICEMLWLKAMLKELGVHSKDPMKLYCDNKAAISIAHNPVQHDRTKHVEVDRHFIKEKLTEGLICTPFVRTENQLADILTKGVSNKIFNSALDKLGIRDIYAPA